jgi:cyclomaltodextrinase
MSVQVEETGMHTVVTPDWVKDAVFYQIFPDRFASSPTVAKPSNLESWDSAPTVRGFKGGDLVGISEHLDYLSDLGVGAIYLTPVFKSTANHRYHTTDYYEVDPICGGNAALRILLDRAHDRGFKIVLDGVFNHVGRGYYQFSHLLENGGQSPYIDWFRVESWPLNPYGPTDQQAGYTSWWGDRELPKLITDTPAVREMIFDVAEHWIRFGIDGWRLDVPSEIDDDDFWREFRRRVKAINPDAYIAGEIWEDASRWLQGDQFDGVQNYLFTKAVVSFLLAGTGSFDRDILPYNSFRELGPLDAAGFRGMIDWVTELYPWPITQTQLNQLDSHDTARFLTMARGEESALRLAMFMQMTYPGAPCIYYGNEVGMSGGPDPACRAAFPWNESQWNTGLRSYVKDLTGLRHRHPVLRRGDFTSLHAADDVYVFSRKLNGQAAVVAINAAHDVRTIPFQALPGGSMSSIIETYGGPAPRLEGGAIVEWSLTPRTGAAVITSWL